MTNLEVEAFLAKHHTVIIPVGATEQHGPHGPLATDVLIPVEIARRVAPRIGAVVAPSLSYALSYPHVGFTGMVHIRIPTFMSLIEDLCASFANIGFKRLVFLNGHYDNAAIAYAYANAAERPWCRHSPSTIGTRSESDIAAESAYANMGNFAAWHQPRSGDLER
jgi:creatinine amidohydrolase